jgi:hypothetical protein
MALEGHKHTIHSINFRNKEMSKKEQVLIRSSEQPIPKALADTNS